MTIRYSLPLLFLGSTVLFAGTHACSTGDVSPPRNTGGSSNAGVGGSSNGSGTGGSSGSFGTGTGGSSAGTGGSSSAGNGGSNGSSGSFGTGTGGSNGSSGTFGAGQGGSSSAGTGGSSVVGAGGSTGAGGGPPVGTDSTFVMNGYGMLASPPWHGYLFTGTYGTFATIMPPMFGMTTGASACVSGNVGMDPAYASGSFLGWNLNQATTGGAGSEMPAATSGTGIQVTFAGAVTGFRVELIDAAALSYCYVLPATTGPVAIPWASFKTNCTDASKAQTPFAGGMSIVKMQVTIGSTPSMSFPFNFCLVSVAGM